MTDEAWRFERDWHRSGQGLEKGLEQGLEQGNEERLQLIRKWSHEEWHLSLSQIWRAYRLKINSMLV